MRTWAGVLLASVVVVSGCGSSGRKSSLLLERPARGQMAAMPAIGHRVDWKFESEGQTQTQNQVDVQVTHAGPAYLGDLFRNKAIFGAYAGPNPYYPEHLVFYVRIVNHSQKRVAIDPTQFVLIDDLGNQYHTLGQDYITAFAESRQPVGVMARGLLEDARPGYFGVSVPVGRLVAQKPIGRFALLLQAALKPGLLYPGTTYDGLIAFWSPAAAAKSLRLLVTDLKTDFDANDFPKTSLEFPFELTVVSQ
ncbi:MAG: hypothetical protein COV75_01910 [Candidatus Omnitrophica bacterium CG11_big_fil_rev_8_21_14_0_20_63_9]|nr:MAG: hypothetical protein COV75_01910 [Candidatus Omnitrophica bacterium CG11_big_fil_rev_8_21_14_0_20_63_9]